MKKMSFFAAFLAAGLTIVSCSDDDNNQSTTNPVQTAEITGKWFFSKDGVIVNGQEVLNNWEHTAGCAKDFMELSTNNVYRDVMYAEDCAQDISTSTWTRTGNSVTIGTGTNAITGEIKTLNASTLKLQNTETEGGVTTQHITVFTRN